MEFKASAAAFMKNLIIQTNVTKNLMAFLAIKC